ncbi:MAG TPA: thioesterase family protein [Polyangiaceae bacterium]|nr:thioesterase family protein [Polyangiaceae bacterium]
MSTPSTKPPLAPGLTSTFAFVVPENKTVPCLYPEAPEFRTMPAVFATGFMVGLIEWACMLAIAPCLDVPAEQSVGTDVKLNHSAATPPGLTVTVQARLERVEGRKLSFVVSAHDGVDEICRGTHERFVIDTARFNAKVADKRQAALASKPA